MRAGALAALIVLAGCSPKAAAPAPQPVALDCTQTFEALKARIVAQPGLRPAPEEAGEPYAFYSSEDGAASWLVTKPGAPGHPAILMQQAKAGKLTTTGCPFGDRPGYEQLVAYLDGLKKGRVR